jgi:hypothetical protein
VTPSSGVTATRTNSGPTMNSGFGREARNTWAPAVPGAATSSRAAISARITPGLTRPPAALLDGATKLGVGSARRPAMCYTRTGVNSRV